MSDIDFRKTVWMADASKAERLRIMLRDPVFTEAVEIALAMNPPRIGSGPTSIQDTALDGARFSGMTQMVNCLKEVSNMEKKEEKPPKSRPVPYSQYTQERSAFAPPPIPKKPDQPKQQ